jgi:hypothetical protein
MTHYGFDPVHHGGREVFTNGDVQKSQDTDIKIIEPLSWIIVPA